MRDHGHRADRDADRLPTAADGASYGVFTQECARSPTLSEGSESVERGSKLVRRGRPSAWNTTLIGQLGPVVGVNDPRTRRGDRLELPSPQVPWRFLSRLGRSPSDAVALVELDHVVLPHVAFRGGHGEDITDSADSLPGRRLQQVVVAIPARLLGRVSDELEDLPSPGRDLAAGADDAQVLMVTGHRPIEAHDADRRPSIKGHPERTVMPLRRLRSPDHAADRAVVRTTAEPAYFHGRTHRRSPGLDANVYDVETLGGDDRDITNIRPAEALHAAGIALVPQYRRVFPR